MICKICGCEMKNNGDWFACPTCGSVHFGPDPDEKKSAEKPAVKKEKPLPEIKKEPVKKEDPFIEIEKEIVIKEASPVKAAEKPIAKAEPPVKAQEKPIAKAEPPVKIAKAPAEKSEPTPENNESAAVNTPKPDKKPAASEDKAVVNVKDSEETSVKPPTFTPNEAEIDDTFSAFLDKLEDAAEEEPPKQKEIAEKAVAEEPETDNEEEEEEEETNDKKKKLTLKDIVDFMLPIVAAVVIAFVLKTFIIANAKVPTGSMIATINVEDRIIASRLAYRTDTPQRYDIVLFYYPDDESDIFVKRVLGLPGETLEVIDGTVYVTTKDGKTIQTDQSFVNPAETPSGNSGPYYIPEKGETITVDGSYCFAENGMVLGRSEFVDKYCDKDERGNYVIAENLYFMMGDNRNQSHDSRAWDFPYVAEKKIIGKVLFKYYPSFEKIQ